MYDLMIYSLKVGVCLAVFYLFFKLLLSRETFHRFNRIVVLGAMFLSFVLPLCVITVYREIPVLPEIYRFPNLFRGRCSPGRHSCSGRPPRCCGRFVRSSESCV